MSVRSLQIVERSTDNYDDTRHFMESIPSTLHPHTHEPFFNEPGEIIVARAPGRLDVMGGIADYSGSLVLQLPIADATHVALQRIETDDVSILSASTPTQSRYIEINLAEFFITENEPISYVDARRRFATSNHHWAAYVAGAFLVLMREKNVRFDGGARILIHSDVPEGKGVSSSAAVEVATMQALVAAFELDLQAQEIARLCQKVENLIAGAPCGIMDQMTSACGEENRLLELVCQPDILRGSLALPDELAVWGIDSGVRHSVRGSDYGTVRTAAFMGYRIIADIAGLEVTALDQAGKVKISDQRWRGYLANISTQEFEHRFSSALPKTLAGAAFLERYTGITDSVTNVNEDTVYPVHAATRHPIYENERVSTFAATLKNWRGVEQAQKLGELMFGSHQSYSDCGLGSEATDLIAEIVRETDGVYGARITGGGSGGTVAVLGRADAIDSIEHLKQEFCRRTGRVPLVLSGSSSGAGVFNYLKLKIA
jgi:galactokinase